MADYTLAVGTHDPHGFASGTEQDAIDYAVRHIESRHSAELERMPEEVVTLLGPGGLVSRSGERIDEFVKRLPGPHPGIDPNTIQTGDANTPDCNGD